jgi:hypothetical protein
MTCNTSVVNVELPEPFLTVFDVIIVDALPDELFRSAIDGKSYKGYEG